MEKVRIQSVTPELVVLAGIYGPRGKAPPMHSHPTQREVIRLLEGRLRARIEGDVRDLRAGDVVVIEAGVPHTMFNPHEEPALTHWEVMPSLRTADFFRIHQQIGERRNPLLLVMLLAEYQDVFRLTILPQAVVRPLLAGLSLLGRLAGFRLPAADHHF